MNTPYPWLILRITRPALSFKLDRRVPLMTAIALMVTLIILVWNVGTGEYPISPVNVIKTIFGLETGNADYGFVVNTLRLPRALVAWLVGVMLALAGGIMQSLTRNALASPDITGVTAGAPGTVMTPATVRAVFGVEADIVPDPRTGLPLCIPYGLQPLPTAAKHLATSD